MGEEDLFAYLCPHGVLHWWHRPKWLADVNALLAQTLESGVERLVCAAEARGAGRAAAQAMLLCSRVMGTPIPAPRQKRGGALAGDHGAERNDERPGRGRPTQRTLWNHRGSLSTFLLDRSWRYRLAELNVHLTNQTDALTVPLPERLRFLYPVLRPLLWMWRHAVKRGPK
jgi:hypothetical protein